MSPPLKVKIAVHENYEPLINMLQQLHIDIGSVAADRVLGPDAPAGARLLCFAAADPKELLRTLDRLFNHCVEHNIDISQFGAIVVKALPLEAALAIFATVPVIEVHAHHEH